MVKQRKHNLSLARKSFKDQENIKQKRKAGNICRKWEVSGQNGRVGFSAFFLYSHRKEKGLETQGNKVKISMVFLVIFFFNALGIDQFHLETTVVQPPPQALRNYFYYILYESGKFSQSSHMWVIIQSANIWWFLTRSSNCSFLTLKTNFQGILDAVGHTQEVITHGGLTVFLYQSLGIVYF